MILISSDAVQKLEIKISILNGTFVSDTFQESLQPSSFISDVTALADGNKTSFLDIQSFTESYNKSDETSEEELKMLKRQESARRQYKDFKQFQDALKSKANNIDRMFKEKRSKLRMSLSSYSRDKEKLKKFEEKLPKI